MLKFWWGSGGARGVPVFGGMSAFDIALVEGGGGGVRLVGAHVEGEGDAVRAHVARVGVAGGARGASVQISGGAGPVREKRPGAPGSLHLLTV